MSTQQIGTALGFAVGSYLGYPQLGLVAGSLVGGALTPKQRGEGPRLDDLKVTVSTYGAGLPTLYGTGRMGGNVIWSTNKIEIPTVTESGKGGGSENTSYQAFVHMAVALCYGEIDGIRKLWKDGKLIYDASSDVSVESAIASASSPYSRLTVYYGTETQLPDPVQEIYLGLGNAPAYRGMAYVQMNAVECPGGRVPQFSFEVLANATHAATVQDFYSFATSPANYTGVIGARTIAHIPRSRTGGDFLYAYELGHDYERRTGIAGTEFSDPLLTVTFVPVNGSQDAPQSAYSYLGTFGMVYKTYDPSTGRITVLLDGHHIADGRGEISSASYDSTTEQYAFRVGLLSNLLIYPGDFYSPTVAGDICGHAFYGGLLSIAYYPTGPSALRVATYDASNSYALVDDVFIGPYGASASPRHMFHDDGGLFIAVADTLLSTFKIEGPTVTLLSSVAGAFGTSPAIGTFFSNDSYAIFGPTYVSGAAVYRIVRHRVPTSTAVSVADIILDQCLRAGLTAGQIDVSAITDTIHGYTIANPASSRANLEPLMSAYGIFATEEDGKIKFKKLAAVTSVVTIPYAELGGVEGSAVPGDPMPLSHQQEAELPRSVTVKYINPDFDYQTSAEPAPRQMTESTLDTVVDLPIATNANHAATVAQMLLYIAWNERNKRSFKVSRKYAAVSAGDGVTFALADGALQRWRITKVVDTGALCEWEGVPADESIYTQTAIGAAGYDGQGQQVAPLPPATQMQLLDTSILRDEDNNAGLYVAMDGPSNWNGAQLFVDTQLQGAVTSAAPIGFAETALGDWLMNIVDETNLLTVYVGDEGLSNITRDVLLNGASNVAAIGAPGRWEYIKFQRAEVLGDGRYTLSGLLRGLRGTEHARASHQAGDVFVLMIVDGLLRPVMDYGDIGLEKSYVAVTRGLTLASSLPQTYANTAEGLKPFSPWDLRKSKNAANDQTLTWQRRTRLASNALRGIVPRGEAWERYEVDFFTSSAFTTLAGTLASTTNSTTITSAQQTAMGLTPGGTLHVRVYMLSDKVGRGHSLQEAL